MFSLSVLDTFSTESIVEEKKESLLKADATDLISEASGIKLLKKANQLLGK